MKTNDLLDPTVFVIFGGAGDLTWRKLVPALFDLSQVEAAWQLLMPVLEAWGTTQPSDFPNYPAGSWGPENTQGLLAPGHRWPLPTELGGPANNGRRGARSKKTR